MQTHAKYFSERCVELERNTQMSFEVETPYAVDFNVHHHADPATEYPVKMKLEHQYSGTLALPAGGEYCFMWQNSQDQPELFAIKLHYAVAPL